MARPVKRAARGVPAATAAAAKAPVKKAPVKKAPAKKAPAKKAPIERAPASRSSSGEAGLPQVEAGPLASGPSHVTRELTPAPLPPASDRGDRDPDRVLRLLVGLAVVLLALAGGLGVAALVEHRSAAYESDVIIRFDQGPEPAAPVAGALVAGLTRYLALTSTPGFTNDVTTRAGLSRTGNVDVAALRVAPRLLQLVVHANTPAAASRLAGSAGEELVALVDEDQAGNVANAGDRLAAIVLQGPSRPVRTQPTAGTAALDGALASAAVLVLAGAAAIVRRGRRG
jgi:hypothetical protein